MTNGRNCPLIVVITGRVPSEPRDGFTFVSKGIEDSLTLARSVAGEKNVWVMGGANIIQQFIKLKLFDVLHISVAPVLLQNGKSFLNTREIIKLSLKTLPHFQLMVRCI